MSPEERVRIARVSYLRAVAEARARSSPSTWQRLCTAAKNVHAAERDRDRDRPSSAGASSNVLPRVRPARPQRSVAGGAMRALGSPRLPESLRASVEAEWARARALIAWSRRLLHESRALCSALVELRAAAQHPAGDHRFPVRR